MVEARVIATSYRPRQATSSILNRVFRSIERGGGASPASGPRKGKRPDRISSIQRRPHPPSPATEAVRTLAPPAPALLRVHSSSLKLVAGWRGEAGCPRRAYPA